MHSPTHYTAFVTVTEMDEIHLQGVFKNAQRTHN